MIQKISNLRNDQELATPVGIDGLTQQRTGAVVPVLTGPLRGAKWIIGAAAGWAGGLSVVLNLAETRMQRQAMRFTSPESVCFDIGANVGMYTLLFARYGRKVFAFEPLPRNLSYLRRTLALNNSRNVTVVPCAVAESSGESMFYRGRNCAEGHLARFGSESVATVSCDDFCERWGVIPSIVKIDVEGGELAVLRGAAGMLSRHHPTILLSTHGSVVRSQCLTYLRTLGYRHIAALDGSVRNLPTEFIAVHQH